MRTQKRPKKKIQRENINERVSQSSILVQFDAQRERAKEKQKNKKKTKKISRSQKNSKKTPQNLYNTEKRENRKKIEEEEVRWEQTHSCCTDLVTASYIYIRYIYIYISSSSSDVLAFERRVFFFETRISRLFQRRRRWW